MKKFILRVSAFILTTCLVIGVILFVLLRVIPPQFGDLYQSEIVNKINRLENIEGRKIIYVSGSSGAFCIDSKKISDELGVEFANLALHADFGPHFINEIALDNINNGDILIISYELSAYYQKDLNARGGIALLATSINDHYEYLKYFSDVDKKEFLNYLPAYIFTKLDKIVYKREDAKGVYSTYGFNEYGDINMQLNYYSGNKYYHDINGEYNNISQAVMDNFTKLIDKVKFKGGITVLNYPYMRVSDLNKVDYDKVNIIDNGLQKELGIKPLYPLSEAIKSEKYFYDTANHCNTWGKGEYTNNLIKYLKKYIKENNL